jgi:hypothetical protein
MKGIKKPQSNGKGKGKGDMPRYVAAEQIFLLGQSSSLVEMCSLINRYPSAI